MKKKKEKGILALVHQDCPSDPKQNRRHLNSVDVSVLQETSHVRT